MYSIPIFANQVLRIDMPTGTIITFTKGITGQDKLEVMELWQQKSIKK
jgi:hypothetical protein